MNIEVPDVATILGNLLDNALTAVAQATEKRIAEEGINRNEQGIKHTNKTTRFEVLYSA